MTRRMSEEEIIFNKWLDEKFNSGKYVICDIEDYGCIIRTVVKYRVGEKRMKLTGTRCIRDPTYEVA